MKKTDKDIVKSNISKLMFEKRKSETPIIKRTFWRKVNEWFKKKGSIIPPE